MIAGTVAPAGAIIYIGGAWESGVLGSFCSVGWKCSKEIQLQRRQSMGFLLRPGVLHTDFDSSIGSMPQKTEEMVYNTAANS